VRMSASASLPQLKSIGTRPSKIEQVPEGVTGRPAIYPPPSGVSPRRFIKKVCS
jgi:hypothetical protein